MKYDIQTLEGANHKLTITVTNDADLSVYVIYGKYGCGCTCKNFEIIEKDDKSCVILIPALRCGIYKYQLFAKHISNNEEFLLLQGDIISNDRLCTCGNTNDAGSDIAIPISADIIEVSVEIEGVSGVDGGYYIPAVSADGDLSWTATESDMPLVATVNIRGPQGEAGPQGQQGTQGPAGPQGPQGPVGEIDTSILENYATIAYVDEAVEGAGGGSSTFDMTAYNTFYGKYAACTTNVTSVNSSYQSDLTSWGKWIYDLPNLTSGMHMFQYCSNLTSFSSDLSAMTNGTYMFSDCTGLTTFSADLSSLTTGNYMFQRCSKLTSFRNDLPKLTDGTSMFSGSTNLTSWNIDLPNLTNGNYMFYNCSNLTSWDTPLPNLTSGQSMFRGCTKLTSFEGDLSKLTTGGGPSNGMFANCSNLTSFSGDLSSLTEARQMFMGCTNLTSFNSDLSSLTTAMLMFGNGSSNCSRLDLASVQNIANTIRTGGGSINIGVSRTLNGNSELETAIQQIRDKGWSVNVFYSTYG